MNYARLTSLALAGAAAVATYAPSASARACGGTFCDVGPTSMPVDQTGENILFVMEDGMVEAHVQIQYAGDPENFAWIVPVMAMPEVTAGSDALFQRLLAATVPTFMLSQIFDDCGGGGPSLGCGTVAQADGGRGQPSAAEGGLNDGDVNDPMVVARGVAGAFEYSVLDGGTIDGVVRWLDENGYAQDEQAPELLESYLDADFMFIAFKLRPGTGVNELHPVVIRYEGTEPCVPIRLTRIAAQDDMGVRAFFLGAARVAPTNYRSVEINPLRIDWAQPGANYNDVVTLAVDQPGSDGHGFVTEYAGSSEIVDPTGLIGPRWDASRFIEATPARVVPELGIQGLFSCAANACNALHPLVEGILARYLPTPIGVTAAQYYSCVECYSEEADLSAWSGPDFAAALEERIIAPAERAVDLLAEHVYLTRLFTTLSPHEMTKDPLFHENADLPTVSNVFTATRVNTCEGPSYIEFSGGRRVALAPDGSLPTQMPAAERIAEVPSAGPQMVLDEPSDAIETARAAWNAAQGLDDDSGCGCKARHRGVSGFGWMFLALGFGWWARRRPASS